MIELNNKLVLFVLGVDIFFVTMLLMAPVEVVTIFSNSKDISKLQQYGPAVNPGTDANNSGAWLGIKYGVLHTLNPADVTNWQEDFTDSGRVSVWEFIGILFGLGFWGLSGVPVWLSLPFGIFLSIMNYLLVAMVIGYLKELTQI